MAAGVYDINVEQGADFKLLVTLEDSALAKIDLTGCSLAGQIRNTYSASGIEASFSFNILTQSGSTLGQFEMTLTAAQTSAIVVDPAVDNKRKTTKYIYDVELTDAGGKKTRQLQGAAIISPEVTK